MFATTEGRERFWAEQAPEVDGYIEFMFPEGSRWRGRILAFEPPHVFSVEYFGGTTMTATLESDGSGGTDLHLIDEGIPATDLNQVHAGWVSVLMALKAAVSEHGNSPVMATAMAPMRVHGNGPRQTAA